VVVMVLMDPQERLVPPANLVCLATTTPDHGTPMESACGAHQDHPDPLAHLAQLDLPDQREALEPLADLARMAVLDLPDLLVPLATRARMAAPAQLVPPVLVLPLDPRETPDPLAPREMLDLLVATENVVPLASLAQLAHLANLAQLVHLVKMATKDHPAQLATREALAQMPTTAHAPAAPRPKDLESRLHGDLMDHDFGHQPRLASSFCMHLSGISILVLLLPSVDRRKISK
jgi:hypothetical protein